MKISKCVYLFFISSKLDIKILGLITVLVPYYDQLTIFVTELI